MSTPETFNIVAMECYDPRNQKHSIRYVAHSDYHCQTTVQLAEARRYKSPLAAEKAADKFNLAYEAGTNEAARFHSNQYKTAKPLSVPNTEAAIASIPIGLYTILEQLYTADCVLTNTNLNGDSK